MFVTFAGIEPPNAIDEDEARWLHEQLLRGQPSETQAQTALKIQRGWEQGIDVDLDDQEKRDVVAILNRAAEPGGRTTDRLRWLQQNMRRSLGEDVH